jgi:type I restriction enzyme M protein
VDWKKHKKIITDEAEREKRLCRAFWCRITKNKRWFVLFLQHMLSKMKPEGSRIGIVFNGSPLFTGQQEVVKVKSVNGLLKMIGWKQL